MSRAKGKPDGELEFVEGRIEAHSKMVIPDQQKLRMLFEIVCRHQRNRPERQPRRWAAAKRKLLKLMKVGDR